MKLHHSLLILLLASLLPAAAQDTIRHAEQARLFLKVPAGQPALTDLHVAFGTHSDSNWEKDIEAAKRQKDVRFPIRWWSWQETTITFTPQYDGPLELILTGNWAKNDQGGFYREESLWDDISATGAEIVNGGFETRGGDVPDGWSSPWGPYPAASEWPFANAETLTGNSVGASWHNRPLQQKLTVKAGREVTLTLNARSATPPGFVVPKRYGKDTPAHQAAAKIKRGVNFGNSWESTPPYSWGVRFTTEDVDRAAAEGFDHLRIPVAWHNLFRESEAGLQISPEHLADIDAVVDRALGKGMRVLVDWHHFYDLDKDPAGNKSRFIEGWKKIATHYKDHPAELFFELLNEPHGKLTTEILNPIQTEAIAAIRKINPERIIVISPGDWGKITELDKLQLPDDDRLIVTVHCYEPFFFTHQSSSWTHLGPLKGVLYPGPPSTPLALPEKLAGDRNLADLIQRYNTAPASQNPSSAIKPIQLLDIAKRWSDHFGRPVHLGEFGAIDTADHDSRNRYVREVRLAAEERGIPWTLWDWKARFGYWDSKTNQPTLRAAIFE